MPSDIEHRLQALEDQRSIVNTLYQYARALDHGTNANEFLDCFSSAAVWWSSIDGAFAGGSTVRYVGHADLRQAYVEGAPRRGQPGHFTKHIVWKPEVDLDGDTARVETYCATLRETPDGPSVYSLGRCLDTFVRSGDGRWRIQERHLAREAVVHEGRELPVGYD